MARLFRSGIVTGGIDRELRAKPKCDTGGAAEVLCISLRNQKSRPLPAKNFLNKEKLIDLDLRGWKRVRNRIRSLRKEWCERWLEKANILLADNDDPVCRHFNHRLFDFFFKNLIENEKSAFSPQSVEAAFSTFDQCFRSLGHQIVKDIGASASADFYDRLGFNNKNEPISELVCDFFQNEEAHLNGINRTTLPTELKSLNLGNAERIASIDPNYRRVFDLVKRYGRFIKKNNHAFTPMYAPSSYFGNAEFTVYKTFLRKVKIDGEPLTIALSNLKLKSAFENAVTSVRLAFSEFAKHRDINNVSKSTSDMLSICCFTIERFGNQNHLEPPDFFTIKPERYNWFQNHFYNQLTDVEALSIHDFFYRLVQKYSKAIGIITGFGGRLNYTHNYGYGITIAPQHWDNVEANALNRLGNQRNQATPLQWDTSQSRKSYCEQYFGSGFLDNNGHFQPGQWFEMLGDTYMQGVVFLEGCMRAYLRETGFSMQHPSGNSNSTDFFDTIKSDLASAPSWRWTILREAYLAALIWAWSEFLFGGWGPFSKTRRLDFRSAFSLIGSDIMSYAKELAAPIVGFKPMPVKPTSQLHGPYKYWSRFYTCFNYKQNHLPHHNDLAPQSSISNGNSTSLNGLNLLGVRLEPMNYGNFQLVGNDEVFSEDMHENGSTLYSLRTQSMARAAQLIGSWLIAGHARHATAAHANRIRHRVSNTAGSKEELAAWMPVGVMNLDKWLAAPGLVGLFTIPQFSWKSQATQPSNFSLWVKGDDNAITDNWNAIVRAPLSYSYLDVSRDVNYEKSEQMSAVFWFDRALRAIGQNLDPVTLLPLENPAGARAAGSDFIEWRHRVWSPLMNLGHAPIPESDLSAEPTHLKPNILALWKAWMQLHRQVVDPKARRANFSGASP